MVSNFLNYVLYDVRVYTDLEKTVTAKGYGASVPGSALSDLHSSSSLILSTNRRAGASLSLLSNLEPGTHTGWSTGKAKARYN